jgi:hypothetical protein
MNTPQLSEKRAQELITKLELFWDDMESEIEQEFGIKGPIYDIAYEQLENTLGPNIDNMIQIIKDWIK